MGRRVDLHVLLVNLLGNGNVYFQPPENLAIKYPCIIYDREANKTKFADGKPYAHKRRYSVMVIDEDPDTEIPDRIADLPMCVMQRSYTADNLNHYVFDLYY